MTPDARTIGDALRQSAPLVRLRALIDESNARYAAIRPALPAPLAQHVRPGPVDENGWSLLAANAAVGAKLRQLQPHLEELLRQGGWAEVTIRIKVGKASSTP